MQSPTLSFKASGKLMLFGEYLVLNGAKSLAFPLKFGQTLSLKPSNKLRWKSVSPQGEWFNAEYDNELQLMHTNDNEVAEILRKLLVHIRQLQPELNLMNEYEAVADFNLLWGFGSSSTLISLLSQWSKVNPYELLKYSFGGSAYDIACATASGPITYQLDKENQPIVEEVKLNSEITNHLLFIFLGKKQNSRNEIKRFKQREIEETHIQEVNDIIYKALSTKNIDDFEILLNKSEDLLSPIIGKPKLKDHIFTDYKYAIKSLGAWGGDFFMATFRDLEEAKTYFKSKQMNTIFTYNDLVK